MFLLVSVQQKLSLQRNAGRSLGASQANPEQREGTTAKSIWARLGGKLSDRCLEGLCRRQLELDCSVHGFRSSLRDWLGNETDPPRETCEEILSHVVSGVEGAYQRSSSTGKKRTALELWAAYLTGASATPPTS
jgi:hypothetical protein